MVFFMFNVSPKRFERLFDLTSSVILLLVFSLPMLLISIAIFCRMGKPILFRQSRTGLNGDIFTLYKFRTMREPSDFDHPNAENRLTPLGNWLRRTSLDELPQLFNIVKGDMRLVGPRPLLVEYLPHYTQDQFRRHAVKPGITGWAQINGRNSIEWDEKFSLDLWYVDNKNFLLDLKILWMTLFSVMKKHNINQLGYVGAKKFSQTKSKPQIVSKVNDK